MMNPMPAPSRPSRATAGAPELVTRAKAGDRTAFEALYRQHVGRVYGLCLRMTGHRSSAEELTQQAFVRAWVALRAGWRRRPSAATCACRVGPTPGCR